MSGPNHTVFLSYASEDAEAVARICVALRASGIEVWFDQSELRGGDAWDASIRNQIRTCHLFVPVISKNAHARSEGYFRLEWKLAVDRSHLIASNVPFVVPVVIDETMSSDDRLPDLFRELQWTRLPGGATPPEFAQRLKQLMSPASIAPGVGHAVVRLDARGNRTGIVARVIDEAPKSVRVIAGWLAAGAIIIVVGCFAVNKFLSSDRTADQIPAKPKPAPAPTAISAKSIAVLPFVDMSEHKDQEYFSDGLSEELIDHLANSPDLLVIARTSSFQFKGKNEDVRQIAKTLGVANLLEGSVRKSGGAVRITVQLVQAADGAHLWSQTYDRQLRDIFKVQEEIAGTIDKALHVALRRAARIEENPKIEAYNLKLQADEYFGRYNATDVDKAASLLRDAVTIDPNYARAWRNLGSVYYNQASNRWQPAGTAMPKARAALATALRLDPDLISAHYTLSGIYMAVDWDWTAAQSEIDEMREIDPDNPDYLPSALADLDALFGRIDEAISIYGKLATRNPLDGQAIVSYAAALYAGGRKTESISTLRRLIDVSPNFAQAHTLLAEVLVSDGKLAEALAIIEREPDSDSKMGGLPIILWAVGRQADSTAAIQVLMDKHADDDAYSIAAAYAYRGENEVAFQWLERAYRQHDDGVAFIKFDPNIWGLKKDRRFKAFLHKMRLPE